jgi:hypothetical protein
MLSSVEHWEDWFRGTNDRFLAAPCPKLLILADLEALDGPLTVAQMQGRFQCRPIAGAGHLLHEDAPDKVGEALCSFLSRSGVTRGAESALLEAKLKRAREWSAAHAAGPPHGSPASEPSPLESSIGRASSSRPSAPGRVPER